MSGPPSRDLLEIAREEAQRTVDEQNQTLNDIDTKAIQILRLNVLLIGTVLTLVSLTLQPSDQFPRLSTLINSYTVLGTGTLLLSAALAALTYTASTNQIGVNYEDILTLTATDGKYSNLEILDGLVVEGYGDWIRFNDETNIINSLYITLTILTLIYAISLFSLGIVVASPFVLPWYGYAILLAALVGYTYLSGIKKQGKRYVEARSDSDDG